MRSETRKESYEGWPIPSIKNIEDEEGFSPFLSGFALGTDPSPGLGLNLVERLRMTLGEIPARIGRAEGHVIRPRNERKLAVCLRLIP